MSHRDSNSISVPLQPGEESSEVIKKLQDKLLEMGTLYQQLQEYVSVLEQQNKKSSTIHAANTNDENLSGIFMKAKLKEVVEMNVNWQKSYGQQEQLMKQLNEKIERLEKELESRQKMGELPESQQREFDRLLLTQKHERTVLEEEKIKIEDENCRLKQAAEREQIVLKKALSESQERLQLLEAQLILYQEDFKTERADRERAQSRSSEQELELIELRKQLQGRPVQVQQQQVTERYHPYDGRNYGLQETQLRGRGNLYQTDHVDECDGLFGFRSIRGERGGIIGNDDPNHCNLNLRESLDEDDATTTRGNVSIASASAGNQLSCPNCRKMFSKEKHLDLIEHMEVCQ